MKPLTAIELAEELFKIHTHAELLNDPEEIVYRQEDILKLFKKLGYPQPDYEGYSNKVEWEILSPPGETVWDLLREKGIKVSDFREMLCETTDPHVRLFWSKKLSVNKLLCGDLAIDDAIASDLERVLGIDKQFWLNREKNYREKLAKLDGK